MIPLLSPLEIPPSVKTVDVILNGRVLGVVKSSDASKFVKQVRILKATGKNKVRLPYMVLMRLICVGSTHSRDWICAC